MAWPTPPNRTNTDAGIDRLQNARADLLATIDALADIIGHPSPLMVGAMQETTASGFRALMGGGFGFNAAKASGTTTITTIPTFQSDFVEVFETQPIYSGGVFFPPGGGVCLLTASLRVQAVADAVVSATFLHRRTGGLFAEYTGRIDLRAGRASTLNFSVPVSFAATETAELLLSVDTGTATLVGGSAPYVSTWSAVRVA